MNLYIFNETRRGAVYGVGTYIRELTDALKNSHINVCVINLMSDKPQIQMEEVDGVGHWYFPAPKSERRTMDYQKQRELYHYNVVYLLQLHIDDKKDLIFHLNFTTTYKFVESLRKSFDCKIVTTIHFTDWGFAIYDNLQPFRNILNEEPADNFSENLKKTVEEEKLYYSKLDHAICVSFYLYEILCQDYRLKPANTTFIPNGLVDMVNTQVNRSLLRKKWHLSGKEKIILFAGRMNEVKGLNYLIRAFREVLTRFPNCSMIIAGNGDYDTYLSGAKDICSKIIFTGFLENKKLYELYHLADVGVMPSLFEPFGYVAAEMMMHGLPIVTTATSGLNEVVDDTCGLKIPLIQTPDRVEIDTDLLAEKIICLLQHPVEAKKMGRNGRKRFLKEYSSEIFRKNMIQFYESLLFEYI